MIEDDPAIDRRSLLAGIGAGFMTAPAWAAGRGGSITMPFDNGERPIVRVPQKRPMIGLTARPPQLETPFAVFREGLLTPNDAFFVRYHLANIPLSIDPDAYRLTIGGHVATPLSLSLADLKRDFPATEIVAVAQCSGNSRGFVSPRVGGGQLGNGAMGNARWRGVPLRALLDRAGIKAGAVDVSFDGLDKPPLETTPDFVKALSIDHARDGEVMVAWSMNGADLPFLNGYPLRLIVPGHYATYWVKHLDRITVLDAVFNGYWMKTAYRIPDNDCACVPPGTKPERTRPIGRFNIRSFITSHVDGQKVRAGRLRLEGIAFDGGAGIAKVELSTDNGFNWHDTTLGEDLGRYSFRGWRVELAVERGALAIMARAIGRTGEAQPLAPRWQPAGYMRNVVETVRLTVA